MKPFLYFVLVLLIVSSAQAGTLISGSSVDVKSNYDGFNGLSLVGTWSTTPAVNDRLSITGAALPDPYGLRESVDIDIPAPRIDQVFRVTSQTRLVTASFEQQVYQYWNLPFGKSAAEICQEMHTAKMKTYYAGRVEIGYPYALIYNDYCAVQFVIEKNQLGYIGRVQDQGIYYEQTINLDGVGTLRLVRNENEDDLTDRIDGVGRATLLSFGTWTNAKLSERDLYAFDANPLATAQRQWKPFDDTTGLNSYTTARKNIEARDSVANPCSGWLTCIFQRTELNSQYTTFKILNQQDAALMTNEANRLLGESGSLPSSWAGRTSGSVRLAANDIIVPLERSVYVSNIQLVLKGDKFGLYIPTGTPKIVSAGTEISFDETKSGNLAYTVKNIGTDTGSFVLRGVCADGKVLADSVDMTLKAGESKSGELLHTAKSDTFDATQKVSCFLEFKETQNDKKETRAYSVNIIVKQLCVEGEQTDPKFTESGNKQIVYILDAQCNVKETRECDLATGVFAKVGGLWVCQDREDVDPPEQDEEKELQVWLLVIAGILGVIGGGVAGFFAFMLFSRVGIAFAVGAALVAFLVVGVLIMVGVAMIAQFVTGQFFLSAVLP